jgi:hypothetical protein
VKRYTTLIVNKRKKWTDVFNRWDQIAKPYLAEVDGRILFNERYPTFAIIIADIPILQSHMEVWFKETPLEAPGEVLNVSPDDLDDLIVLDLEEDPDCFSDGYLFVIAREDIESDILEPYIDPYYIFRPQHLR